MAENLQTNREISPRNDGKGRIWSYIRSLWLIETPEEIVRQDYVCHLVNEYGFALEQMDEEISPPGDARGRGDARADILIWRTIEDKRGGKKALIVVECKADTVTIDRRVYEQGAHYAQYEQAKFFVTHNSRETKFWKVDHTRRFPNFDEITDIPHADASDREIDELISKLKTFKEDEFADLLHQCHNVIRNREKLDPAAAFDEIAKILFVKVWVERELKRKRQRKNLFTAEWLDSQLGDNPLNSLFEETKKYYSDDRIFEDDEEIRLKYATGKEIVSKLERYNLSDTSEDIKGIAFERFLGRTFRGEIGQFFTPRQIVEFMIRMMEPKEGDIICDPASGSGGFLIRFFEIVRQQILASADAEYQEFKTKLEKKKGLSEAKKAEQLRNRYFEIHDALDQHRRETRLWKLANRCIYGTDANDRMARTSKMNMIMHGDGHGGVHHHDGFINVNGIFEGRFDIILTNPPFGANVESSDVIHEADVTVSREAEKRYREDYPELYEKAMGRVRAAIGKPIASLFELPKSEIRKGEAKYGKIKTEILFIERCLSLLRPGGRLGIVLPEGIFNNPSLSYVREFCENRAFIRAIVSLPQETFFSSGASVKASLLFLQKFTLKEQSDFDKQQGCSRVEIEAKYAPIIKKRTFDLEREIEAAVQIEDAAGPDQTEQIKALNKELDQFEKQMEETIVVETRALLKKRFPYPVFLYEAEHVGITATGEDDFNELCGFPKDNLPSGVNTTAFQLYQKFKKSPNLFLQNDSDRPRSTLPILTILPATLQKGAFTRGWKDLERWDTFFYRKDFLVLEQDLDLIPNVKLGEVLNFDSRGWKAKDFPDGKFRYIEISAVTKEEGIHSAQEVLVSNAPSRATTRLQAGDIILSTTRPYLGAFAIVPNEYDGCVCSSGFALATRLLREDFDKEFLLLFLRSKAGLKQFERRMTGGLYPSIVQEELEKIRIPLLPLKKQIEIANRYKKEKEQIRHDLDEAIQRAKRQTEEIDKMVVTVSSA